MLSNGLFVWLWLVVNDHKFLAGIVFFSHTNQPAVLLHEPVTKRTSQPNRLRDCNQAPHRSARRPHAPAAPPPPDPSEFPPLPCRTMPAPGDPVTPPRGHQRSGGCDRRDGRRSCAPIFLLRGARSTQRPPDGAAAGACRDDGAAGLRRGAPQARWPGAAPHYCQTKSRRRGCGALRPRRGAAEIGRAHV